ncbi:MAG TPA: GNAT family N-acetyltransferase [Xanthobacteraceae bacterium]|nr:GNAT family N-acetyltransferase [Xanthobacteraceae bacterium]
MIRSVEPGDFAEWDALWRGYQTFYEVAIAPETTQVTWQRLLDPAEPMWGALAIHEGRAVGLVHMIRHRSTWTVSDYCYLQDLFVDEAVRGRGIARRLIAHVYEAAAGLGCSRVYWLTHETNATARALYDRVADRSGFIQYRKLLEAISPAAAPPEDTA